MCLPQQCSGNAVFPYAGRDCSIHPLRNARVRAWGVALIAAASAVCWLPAALAASPGVRRLPAPLPGPLAGVTLSDLEQLAEANHPGLRAAEQRVRAQRGRTLQAGLYPNPSGGYLATEIGNEGSNGQHGGYVGQTIVTKDKLALAVRLGQRGITQSRQEWAVLRQRVLNDVRSTYYRLLILQRRLQVTEQLIELSENAVQLVRASEQALDARRTDVLQAEVQAERARLAHRRLEVEIQAVWQQMAALTGADGMRQTLVGDVEAIEMELDWEEVNGRAQAESPQLADAIARVEVARAALSLAVARRWPNLNSQVTLQNDAATGDEFVGVQLGAKLPLWNRNQGNIVRARADLFEAHQNVERARRALQYDLSAAYREYRAATASVEAYRERILARAEESMRLATAGFRAGEAPYLDVLAAQQTLFRSNLEYLNSLELLWTSRQKLLSFGLTNSFQ